MNRIHNSTNPYQGNYKKVLCVCSAGLLRSPTAAWILSNKPYNFNTRAAGLHDYALIPVDEVLLEWAECIVCMDKDQQKTLQGLTTKQVFCLDIPDAFSYRDPKLVKLIKKRFKEVWPYE